MRNQVRLGERRKKRQRYENKGRGRDDRVTALRDMVVRWVTARGVASFTTLDIVHVWIVVVVVVVVVDNRFPDRLRMRVSIPSDASHRCASCVSAT